MKFAINELDSRLFQSETGMNAIEHPHIYLQWMNIKMSEKILKELQNLGTALEQKKG